MKRSWLSWFAILAMMLLLFAVTGCSDDDDDNNGGGNTPYDVTGAVIAAGDLYFDDYMIEFNGTPMGVNMPEDQAFAELSKASHDYYLIDLRNQVDFDNFHIAGAVNVPLSSLVDELDNMPTDKIILVMCYSGQTASYATSIINLIGTQSGHVARNLKFGASGILPIEAVFEHGNYTYPQTNDNVGEMVANAGAASPAKNDPGEYPVLEADVDNDLDALKVRARAAVTAWSTDDCKMSNGAAAEATPATLYLINYWSPTAYANGHLDDAIQYTPPKPSESIESDFLSTKALNTLPTDLPIGVYCYTGQTSAQVAAYLQMVGYDAKTVVYGVQKMAADNETINPVNWHGPSDDYSVIYEGTGVPQ